MRKEGNLLGSITKEAFDRLDTVGGDFTRLEDPYKTVVIITSAQGVIDNGGFRYFFESDWPGNPPYAVFADAYQRIGRIEAAVALCTAAASFGVDQPELDSKVRNAYIDQHIDHEVFEVKGWNDCVCGDKRVWEDLENWVRHFL